MDMGYRITEDGDTVVISHMERRPRLTTKGRPRKDGRTEVVVVVDATFTGPDRAVEASRAYARLIGAPVFDAPVEEEVPADLPEEGDLVARLLALGS